MKKRLWIIGLIISVLILFGPARNADAYWLTKVKNWLIMDSQIENCPIGAETPTTGAFTTLTATTLGGIVQANLVDKTAVEEITGKWTFSDDLTLHETSFSDSDITNVGDIAIDSISADDGSSFTISDDWTNAGNTVADAGTLTTVVVNGGTITGITDLVVADGGIGVGTLADGGILLGSGTDPITAMAVLADGSIVIGDGTTDPVALAAFSSSTGTLNAANGGTGVAALTAHCMVVGTGTSPVTILTAGGANEILCGAAGADPSFRALLDADIPDAITVSSSGTLSSPPAIGSVAANTGAFTTLAASGAGTLHETTFSDSGITNVGDIALDSITADDGASFLINDAAAFGAWASHIALTDASSNTNAGLGQYFEISSEITAGKVMAAEYSRLKCTTTQANQCTLVGTESQFRLYGDDATVSLVSGVHAGLWAYAEQSGVSVLGGGGTFDAISATVESAAGFTVGATEHVTGITLDSSINGSASIDGSANFSGIYIKSNGKDWFTGLKITGVTTDIELQNGATISEAVNGTVAISDSATVETDLDIGDDITRDSKPVPTCEDSASPTAKPLIEHGSGVGGSEDGTITFPREFGAIPNILLTVSDDTTVDTCMFSAHVVTRSTTGFTYEIRQNLNGTITDTTTSDTCFYIAVGHE